jgi:hypothetical protein
MLKAPEKRERVSSARRIEYWKWRNAAVKRQNAAVKRNCGGRGGLCSMRTSGDR